MQDILLCVSWREIANTYFDRPASWLYNKLNAIDDNGGFTEKEKELLRGALFDLSERIRRAAETILAGSSLLLLRQKSSAPTDASPEDYSGFFLKKEAVDSLSPSTIGTLEIGTPHLLLSQICKTTVSASYKKENSHRSGSIGFTLRPLLALL